MIVTPLSESVTWWQKPDWVIVFVGAVTFLFGLVKWIIDHIQKSRERYLRICKAGKFDPEEIVAAANAKGFNDYLPTTQDDAIWLALHEGESIGLRGRPGIGKSHSAAFHVRNLGLSARGDRYRAWWWLGKILSRLHIPGFQDFCDWYVIRPLAQELQDASLVRVRKRRYVLLLDDLNDYVRNDDATAVLDLMSSIRLQSKQLIILSTLRSTAPEDLSVSAISKIFGRWKWIDLPDWHYDQGERLAQKCGAELYKWDGTPLSVKQPSSEMRSKYDDLVLEKPAATSILRCLFLFREHGLFSVPRKLLKNACATEVFNVNPSEFESALTIINRFGFLKTGTQFIEAYGPYLDTIQDWSPNAIDDYLVIRDLLVSERRIPELITIAWEFSAQEKFREAEWICRKCVELAPRKASIYVSLGKVLRKQGDLCGAEAAFKTAVNLIPDYLRARSLLAGTWVKLGRLEEAERAYRRVLDSAPKMFEAIFGFGILLLEKGDFEGAEERFRRAIQIRPESARAMSFLAEALVRLNRNEQAEPWFKMATELEPQLLEAHLGYAMLLLKNKDFAGSLRESQRATGLNAKSAMAHFTLGQSLQGLGRLNDAEDSLRTAVSINPSQADFRFALGVILNDEAKYGEARDIFSQMIDLDPNFARVHSYLAEVWAHLGNLDESERCYRTALKIDPNMPEVLTGLGMTLLKKCDYTGAEKAFVRSLEIIPGTSWVYARLADALRRQGKLDEAEEMNRKGLTSDPETLRLRYVHGITCLVSGELAHAEGAFRDVLSFECDNLDAWSRLAEALIRQGKHEELSTVIEKILQLDPQVPAFYLGPGMAALRCEEWNVAETFFRKAIGVDPDHARAHQHLGHSLLNQHRIDEAVKVLRDAVGLNPQMSKAFYLLGKALLEKSDLRGAELALRESVRIKRDFAESHICLGATLERRGRSGEAVVEYEAALALKPDSVEAKDRLESINAPTDRRVAHPKFLKS